MFLSLFLIGCGVDLTSYVPTVKFSRLDLTDLDFDHIDTNFVFSIDNPNPVGAPVDRFAYNLQLMDVDILSGDDPNGVTLAAEDTSELMLPVSFNFANLYEAVTATRGEDFMDFGLQGGFGFDSDLGPVDINFDEAGSYPALRIPKITLGKLKVQSFTGTTLGVGLDIDLDNDHASTIDFADIGFNLHIAGVNIGDGALSGTESVDGASSRTITLPITVDVIQAAGAAAAIIAGQPVDVELDFSSNVNTPFGVLPLHVDESGNVTIQDET